MVLFLKVECTKDEITGYTVKRIEFDYFLLKKAIEAGADVRTEMEVSDIDENNDHVTVKCADGTTFNTKYLVGADGVNSRVARSSGIKTKWEPKEIGLCMEARVPMDPEDIMRITGGPYDDSNRVCIQIFFGGLEHAYAWCFPKKNEVSLGMGVLMPYAPGLKKAWNDFVSKYEQLNGVKIDLAETKAMRVPLGGPIERTVSKRIMLIGDAGGFVSPATGEGIYYAIETGQIAADVAYDALHGKTENVLNYEKRWKKGIGKQLNASKFLANLMFNSEKNMELAVQMAASDTVMRGHMTDLIGGLRPYTKLRNAFMKRVLTKHPLKGIRMLK